LKTGGVADSLRGALNNWQVIYTSVDAVFSVGSQMTVGVMNKFFLMFFPEQIKYGFASEFPI
jgi:hypothetical protein